MPLPRMLWAACPKPRGHTIYAWAPMDSEPLGPCGVLYYQGPLGSSLSSHHHWQSREHPRPVARICSGRGSLKRGPLGPKSTVKVRAAIRVDLQKPGALSGAW